MSTCHRSLSPEQLAEASTYSSLSCCTTERTWDAPVPVTTTVYARPPHPQTQKVVYNSYAVPSPRVSQQVYYAQTAQMYWADGNQDQCVLPKGEEAANIRAAAQRIGQDAASTGTQVYGKVKNAVDSDVTQGIFRSVGDLVSGAFEKMKQGRP